MERSRKEILSLLKEDPKELRSLFVQNAKDNNVEELNKWTVIIKQARTIKGNNFLAEVLPVVALNLSSNDYFLDELDLKYTYSFLSDYKEDLIESLIRHDYTFSINQIRKLSNSNLLLLLTKNENNIPFVLDELNMRMDNNNFNFSKKNSDYIYFYFLESNRFMKLDHPNMLIMDDKFIEVLDKSSIDGSTIVALTKSLNTPRKKLIKKCKKVKQSILGKDDLFNSKDILDDFTKKEIVLLHDDHDISNYLMENGYRFDALPESKYKELLDNINSFNSYSIYSFNEFVDNYKDIKELTSNNELVFTYLNKLDNNFFYKSKLISNLTRENVKSLLEDKKISKVSNEAIYHLFKDTNSVIQGILYEEKKLKDIIKKCNVRDVLVSLDKKILKDIVKNNKNIFEENVDVINLLSKEDIRELFVDDKLYDKFIKKINEEVTDVKDIVLSLPEEIKKDLKNNKIKDLNINGVRSLLIANPSFKNHLINNKNVCLSLTNDLSSDSFDDIDKMFNDGEFTSDERVNFISNIIDDGNIELVIHLIKGLSLPYRSKVYSYPGVINKVMKSSNYILDRETINYLINHPEELEKLDSNKIIDMLTLVPLSDVKGILQSDKVLAKVFSDPSHDNLIKLVRRSPELIVYFHDKQITDNYDINVINKLMNNISYDLRVDLLSDEDILKSIFKKDKNKIKLYKTLQNSNYYLLNTLDFNIFELDLEDVKTNDLVYITTDKDLQALIIDINKEYKLDSSFITNLMYEFNNTNKMYYLKKVLKLILDSVNGKNRKRIGNVIKLIGKTGSLDKRHTKLFINYLLYFVIKDGISVSNDITSIIETPIASDELYNYEKHLEEILTSKIEKENSSKVIKWFILKHLKLTLDEAREIQTRFDGGMADKNADVTLLNDVNYVLSKSVNELKELDSTFKVNSMMDTVNSLSSLINSYSDSLNLSLIKNANKSKLIKYDLFGKTIDLYSAPSEYSYLYVSLITNNYKAEYEKLISKGIINANYISDLALNNSTGVNIGFGSIPRNSLRCLGYSENNKDIKVSYKFTKNMNKSKRTKYISVSIDTYLNNKSSNVLNLMPDYIIVYKDMLLNKDYMEHVYMASQEFKSKQYKEGLPIIVIDENKVIDKWKKDLSKLKETYNKTHDLKDLRNYVGKFTLCNSNLRSLEREELDINILLDVVKKRVKVSNSKKELESIYYIFKDECDKYYNKSYCDFNLKDIKELVSK